MSRSRPRGSTLVLWTLGGVVGTLLLVFALAVGPWLFTRYPRHGLTSEQALKAKNDVRTTLVQACVGLAVASGAVVTYRTFHQNRLEHDRAYRLQKIEQVNEFFATAVDQLGNQHAPVRLGALYSLGQLAQANPDQRTSVIDVICGYLRMPYAPSPPAHTGGSGAVVSPGLPLGSTGSPPDDHRDAHQELQVRLTAQRLLAAHLRPPDGHRGEAAQRLDATPDEDFWPGVSLDLTGAALVDLDLREASVDGARFEGATLTGDTSFVDATFTGDAVFTGASFLGDARFVKTEFLAKARFDQATFTRTTRFDDTKFRGKTWFDRSRFLEDARFDGAVFAEGVWFGGATFDGSALFGSAVFTGDARFSGSTFAGLTRFANVEFNGLAGFAEATFAHNARFGGAKFGSAVRFDRATFAGGAQFDQATFADDGGLRGAYVLHLDDPNLNTAEPDARRIWPTGWEVRPGWDDPTRGKLVRAYRR
ncbi:pentapeptide repeat-containing protein [Actinoplanes sp. NPDC023714]|uniref:pentapeptide repeat-containing protein n=1 Tax=Actinoplanes sp. NPDC023714 TaxID=3154322 RepID=UPI0033CD359C